MVPMIAPMAYTVNVAFKCISKMGFKALGHFLPMNQLNLEDFLGKDGCLTLYYLNLPLPSISHGTSWHTFHLRMTLDDLELWPSCQTIFLAAASNAWRRDEPSAMGCGMEREERA